MTTPNMLNDAPPLLAADLEGVFLPEIWIAVADASGIPELRLTTRDVADYDELMQMRLGILRKHGLRLQDIQSVIAGLDLLPGASDFLDEVRRIVPLIIITDSFYEFVNPVLPKLGLATVFAHALEVDAAGMVTGYRLRVPHAKRRSLAAFHDLGFRTLAVGDSYNDIAMLMQATQRVLYRPPANVCADFPDIPAVRAYDELLRHVHAFVRANHSA
ncbi:MAG: bifunctional phosphoserine phosphatase/homoserine phosphotransferase ThrH [Chloroflexota bacterium]|nr:bifunctional phosphoserine phosphatase/homoserine phosphotransferase ThrH [Chloroflexota bacterium]